MLNTFFGQFQIISLFSIKLFYFDLPITNLVLVNFLVFFFFSIIVLFFSSNVSSIKKSSFFIVAAVLTSTLMVFLYAQVLSSTWQVPIEFFTQLQTLAMEKYNLEENEEWGYRDAWLKKNIQSGTVLTVGYDQTAADPWSTAKAWMQCPKGCHFGYKLVHPSRCPVEDIQAQGWLTHSGFGLIRLDNGIIRVHASPVNSQEELAAAALHMNQQPNWGKVTILPWT